MPRPSSKVPTILIVGDAWHTHHYLGPLAKVFEVAGHPTRCLALPSAGMTPPSTDPSADVLAIRAAAERILSRGKDLIAIFHSISGIPGSDALHGLGKKFGHGAGVRAILYVASMLPSAGESFETYLESMGDVGWKATREASTQDGVMSLPAQVACGMFYHDVNESRAEYLASHLCPQSASVFLEPLVHETWNEIYSGYIVAANDKAIPTELQVETVNRRGFTAHRVLIMETGHVPWLTRPEEVQRFAVQLADQAEAERIANEPAVHSPKISTWGLDWFWAQGSMRGVNEVV